MGMDVDMDMDMVGSLEIFEITARDIDVSKCG